MMENIDELIEKKIVKYPDDIQKIIKKALELAASNQPISVAEQLEGFVKEMTKDNNNNWKEQ